MCAACPEDRIDALSAEADFEQIARLLNTYAFSWDIERALELALFRTYAIPSISSLLARTGEFATRPGKRYDDTELLLSEPLENGLDSLRGRAAISRINEMHGHYRISNDDMIYVLGTFVLEPIHWLDRFGRRAMTPHEQVAWTNYYRALGERLGIRDIPADLADFAAFNARTERDRRRFVPSNHEVAQATLDLLLSFYLPRGLFGLGRPVVLALLDAPLREAMGLPHPSRALRSGVRAAMRLRRLVLRALPRRRRPRLVTARRRANYPSGYEIAALGTWPAGPGACPVGRRDGAAHSEARDRGGTFSREGCGRAGR